jgi:hypothetical protein
VAQAVAKMVVEPLAEPVFHPDSYGYRPQQISLARGIDVVRPTFLHGLL